MVSEKNFPFAEKIIIIFLDIEIFVLLMNQTTSKSIMSSKTLHCITDTEIWSDITAIYDKHFQHVFHTFYDLVFLQSKKPQTNNEQVATNMTGPGKICECFASE